MARLTDLVAFLDRELDVAGVKGDHGNGLLAEGRGDVRRIGLAANATFEVVETAVRQEVDLLLTHHGGWRDIDLHLAEVKSSLLRKHGASHYVAHACLDNSERHGTSTTLAAMLGVRIRGRFAEYCGGKAGAYGEVAEQPFDAFLDAVSRIPGARVLSWRNRTDPVRRVAVLTGAGYLTTWVDEAANLGCDSYLTGEGSMFTTIFAKERGISLVFAGHTATERPAVLRLGETLGIAFPEIEFAELPEAYF